MPFPMVTQVAESTPFRKDANPTYPFLSEDCQSAITEAVLRVQNVRYVNKQSYPGHYSSIAGALASITGASATNQYLVLVGPGVYVEPQLVIPSFVSLHGTETQSVIIQPSDPTDHLIVGGAATTLRYLTIKGVTTAGKAGVYSTASGLQVRNCVVRDNPINILVEGVSNLASITADDLIITGIFTIGIQLKNSGAGVSGIFKGSIINSIGTPSGSKAAVVEGAGVSFIFSSLVAQGISTAHCLTAKNGATLKVLAAEIKGFDKAIWVENVGSAPVLDLMAVNLDSNNMDIQNDHPATTGIIHAIARRTNVSNAAPNSLQLTYHDPVTGDLNVSRILATRGWATDLTSVSVSNTVTQIVSTDAFTYYLTGSVPGQIMQLPDATTLRVGHRYEIFNESSTQVVVRQFGGSNPIIMNTNGSARYVLRDNSTSAGIWIRTAAFASTFAGGSAPTLASYNGNANTGRYLEIWPSLSSDTDPFIVPSNEVLVAVVFGAEASSTATVGVFRTTDLVNPITTISLVHQTEAVNVSLNLPLVALDKLAVRIVSGTVNKPRFAFYLSGI